MKKNQSTLFSYLLMACAGQAATTVVLDLPATGNYAPSTTVTTSVTDGSGATFDILYTVTAISNDTGAVVGVSADLVGVGSDNDINPNHFNSLEGDGSGGANGSTAGGEGLSFTSLGISNFQANGSGLTAADITDLQFTVLNLNNVGNNNDGIDISFTDFGVSTANLDLNPSPTGSDVAFPLSTFGNYSAPATAIFVEPDSGQSSNRWNVSGLTVTYVPEPSSSLLLGGSALMMLIRRRRA